MIKDELIEIQNKLVIKQTKGKSVYEDIARKVAKKWGKVKSSFKAPVDTMEAIKAFKKLQLSGIFNTFGTNSLVFKHILEEVAKALELNTNSLDNIENAETSFIKDVIKKRYAHIADSIGEQKGKIFIVKPNGEGLYISKNQIVKYGNAGELGELYITRGDKATLFSKDLGVAVSVGQFTATFPTPEKISEMSPQIIDNILAIDADELIKGVEGKTFASEEFMSSIKNAISKVGKRNIDEMYIYNGRFTIQAFTSSNDSYTLVCNNKENLPNVIFSNIGIDKLRSGIPFAIDLDSNEATSKIGEYISIEIPTSEELKTFENRENSINNSKDTIISKEDADSLKVAIKSIDKTHSKEELRSVLFTGDNKLVSSDAFGLRIIKDVNFGVYKDTLINVEMLKAMNNLKSISIDEPYLVLKNKDFSLLGKVSSGRYPDYERIASQVSVNNPSKLTFNVKELLDIIKELKIADDVSLIEEGNLLHIIHHENVSENEIGAIEISNKEDNDKGNLNIMVRVKNLKKLAPTPDIGVLEYNYNNLPFSITQGREEITIMPVIK